VTSADGAYVEAGPHAVDRRRWPVLGAMAIVLAGLALLDLCSGRFATTPADVLAILIGQPAADPRAAFVVEILRLPRLLVAVMAGAALAVSGLLLQAVTHNPLAAPGLIGVNGGASAAVVALLLVVPEVPPQYYPFAALAGALLAGGAVYALSWNNGVSSTRFLLIGVGTAALCAALTTGLITFAAPNDAQAALIWLVGSLHGRSWDEVSMLAPWLALLLPAVILSARALDALTLGHDIAAGVGVQVRLVTAVALFASAALASASVATVGALGFVGLIAPHIARALIGARHGTLMAATAATGAIIVLAADLVGRVAFEPVTIPAGIVTALIGVPYFLWLLLRPGNT
jgi:iron complex transport system permease protein